MTLHRSQDLRMLLLWAVLVVLVAWAYEPGLHGPPLLDDRVNLHPLDKLDSNPEWLEDVVFGNESGSLGRPVAMASFVLERLYFDRGIYGQKFTSLLIHLFNGTLVLLLCTTVLRAAGQSRAKEAALLIACLWVSLPLLLSSTLYIVQRMTLLSATFCLLALLAYCRARGALNRGARAWPWFMASGLCILLGSLSKENAVLCVPLIIALEVMIYGFRAPRESQQKILRITHLAVAGLGALGGIAGLLLFPEIFLDYSTRDFNMSERLLTQSRVLWDYVGQILWVDVHRLGVYQDDFPKSEGLLDPASTWRAALGWLLIIAAVLASAWTRRFLLVSFGLVFFLVGHLLESTVIPLELYFEHRNYLPSLGIVFALVAGLYQIRERWPVSRGWMELTVAVLLLNNLLSLGSQAVVWSDDELLHVEAVNYHPRSDRALLSLAGIYAGQGDVDSALALLDKANDSVGRRRATAAILRSYYVCGSGRSVEASLSGVSPPGKDEAIDPLFGTVNEAFMQLLAGEHCGKESAEAFSDLWDRWVRGGDRVHATGQVLASLILLDNELERHASALGYAEQLAQAQPDHVMALQFMLYLSHVLQDSERLEIAQNRLIQMREEGKLSREEVANLEMFF